MTGRTAVISGAAFVVIVVLFYLIFSVLMSGMSGDSPTLGGGGDRIGLLEVQGLILDSESVIVRIEELRKDEGLEAVVLRIDSPGGGVAASQEIYSALLKLRAAGKRLVASMGSVAASGGYYIACAADTIVSNPGTITGSIGVIMEFPQTHELFSKLGIDFEIIKSGRFKDTGSPHRGISDRERQYLQEVIDDAHEQFVRAVADGRRLDLEEVRRIADGKIFTGSRALTEGLVDVLGSQADAVDIAAEMVGIEGEPTLIRPSGRRDDFWNWFLDRVGLPSLKSLPLPRLLYLFSY
jgi:protease-4